VAVWRVQIRFGIKHVHTGGVHLWQLDDGASVPVEEGSPYMGLMLPAVRRRQSLCGSKRVVGRMPTTGRVQKPWEGHGWVMYAMRVQAVVIVETLQQRGCLSIWLGEGGGVRGWQEGSCREDAQKHRTGKKRKNKEKQDSSTRRPTKKANLHRPVTGPACAVHVRVHVFAAAAVVVLVCGCRSWVGGVCVRR